MKKLCVNIFVSILTVSLMLGALECSIRLSRGQFFTFEQLNSHPQDDVKNKPTAPAVYDSYLGYVLRAGVYDTGWVKYTVDATHCRIHTRTALQEHPLIVTVGDSFTYGEGVQDDQTWPAYLEHKTGIRVVNGGVFNYGIDQIVMRAEQLIDLYHPDIVIMSFIPDDISRCDQAFRVYAKPYFRIEEGKLVLYNNPVPPPSTAIRRKMDTFRRVGGYSYLIDFIMRRVAVHYWVDTRIELVQEPRVDSADKSQGVEITLRLLSRLAAKFKENAIIGVLMLQTSGHKKGDNYDIPLTVLNHGQKEGLYIVDCLPFLADERTRSIAEYDSLVAGHMTAKGNEWTANLLISRLGEYNIITQHVK